MQPTDDELDERARELGLWQSDVEPLSEGPIRDSAIALARYKARVSLLEPILENAVYVRDRSGAKFIYPDPGGNCREFTTIVEQFLNEL